MLPSICGIFFAGCFSVQNDNRLFELSQVTHTGDYTTAFKSAQQSAAKYAKSHHRLLWRLHEGYLAYWASEPKASIEAFTHGSQDLQAYEERPSINARDVGSQMLSLLTEPGLKPYKGSVAEGVLLHTYKGLSHAQSGDLSSALAELRQAAHRRKLAHDYFRRQIENASKKNRGLPLGWRGRPEIKKAAGDAYGEEDLLPHYLKFTNPFQIHLEAIFAAHQGSAQNREHARKLWSTLLAMHSEQALMKTYRNWAEQRHASPKTSPPVIHLIHERGQAPELYNDALTLTLPINGRVTGIHLAFADLVIHQDNLPSLDVTSSSNLSLSPIASMDALVKAERKTKDMLILIEQIGSALTKAISENQLAKKDNLLGLGLTIFNSSVNRADTRSWSTLPKSWEGTMIENQGTDFRLRMDEEEITLTPPNSRSSFLLHLKSVRGKKLTYHWIPLGN